MSNPVNKGKGKAIAFLRDNVSYAGTDCLIWPFFRKTNGYGVLGYLGRVRLAHRLMCTLVNGEPPTPDHEAAHSCGRGTDGCVHPLHVSWKTGRENVLERREHGTVPATNKLKLTRAQRREICELKGTMNQREIAAKFGVVFQHVSYIQRTWSLYKDASHHPYDPEEDAILRELYAGDDAAIAIIAEKVGRSQKSVRGRLYRIGLKGTAANLCNSIKFED